MITTYPPEFENSIAEMTAVHADILSALERADLAIEDYPDLSNYGRGNGVAAARAYAMQGILKYHGLADWTWRTAYLPSISINNDAAHTLTLVEFDDSLARDEAFLDGQESGGRALDRIRQILNVVRELGKFPTRARVTSRNFVRASKTGKGLGTSAAASAALATATIAAAFGPELASNSRLVSCTARLLAGSGCRSAVGGLALWLSYPGIAHEDSFAIRLDGAGQLDDLSLITVPIDSRVGLKTEEAHQDAPRSSFFRSWMSSRGQDILDVITSVKESDWQAIGRLAELDSIRLHGVTMSGNIENKIFAWEPENIHLFRMCNSLRSEGIPVYFSTDTGPTTVFLTKREFEDVVVARLEELPFDLEVIRGGVAGPVELIDARGAREQLA